MCRRSQSSSLYNVLDKNHLDTNTIIQQTKSSKKSKNFAIHEIKFPQKLTKFSIREIKFREKDFFSHPRNEIAAKISSFKVIFCPCPGEIESTIN